MLHLLFKLYVTLYRVGQHNRDKLSIVLKMHYSQKYVQTLHYTDIISSSYMFLSIHDIKPPIVSTVCSGGVQKHLRARATSTLTIFFNISAL